MTAAKSSRGCRACIRLWSHEYLSCLLRQSCGERGAAAGEKRLGGQSDRLHVEQRAIGVENQRIDRMRTPELSIIVAPPKPNFSTCYAKNARDLACQAKARQKNRGYTCVQPLGSMVGDTGFEPVTPAV